MNILENEVYREAFEDRKNRMYLLQVMKIDEKEYDAAVRLVTKENGELRFSKDLAALCIWEIKDKNSVEVLYEVEDNYKGTGIGSKLVDFSKEFTKKIGKKIIKLTRLNRPVPYQLDKSQTIDGNLVLYLKHNFKVLSKAYQNSDDCPLMECDLETEAGMPLDDIMLQILNNKKQAYLEMGLK